MSEILENYKNGVKTIKINRPEIKNAVNTTMYSTLANILNKDAKNDEIVITILTGEGDYFTSGNDLKSAALDYIDFKSGLKALSDMIEAFINYPKLIICVVNGPAIGIGATAIALCDIVYASEKAVFDTPFLKLGLCVEACSSYNYVQILGRSVASEMLLLGKKLTSQEAFRFGLVSKVIPHSQLPSFIDSLQQYGSLPVQNIKRNKAVIMANLRNILLEANKREMECVEECVNSDDFANAMMTFFNKKSKL